MVARIFLLWCLSAVSCWALPPFVTGESRQRFSVLPVQASAEEVKARLHCQENPGSFDPGADTFTVHVPSEYRHETAWGVLVWISPSDSARIPAPWLAVLAQKRLLFVGAEKAGNPRNILDRIRLAVSANVAMRERFHVDGRRVYVAGFSGGGRVASMLGVAWADMFSGSLPMMGVNFYTDLPSADGRRLHPPQYIPDDTVLEIAKGRTRHVLITSEKDFNRADTRIVFEKGYRQEGFSHVGLLEIPGLGHGMPPAEWLDRALTALDSRIPGAGSEKKP
ncbi:MAG: hypothetical protein RLZZ399_1634 [Verrucomicrobiota bacterium]|jgi:hypothetical protein